MTYSIVNGPIFTKWCHRCLQRESVIYSAVVYIDCIVKIYIYRVFQKKLHFDKPNIWNFICRNYQTSNSEKEVPTKLFIIFLKHPVCCGIRIRCNILNSYIEMWRNTAWDYFIHISTGGIVLYDNITVITRFSMIFSEAKQNA